MANEPIPEDMEPCPVDIDQPRWDQSRFSGRLCYFLQITNPLLNFKSNSELEEAARLVRNARYCYLLSTLSYHAVPFLLDFRKGYVPSGTTLNQLHNAKVMYDSAYHPDTGERMNLIGRMSFQVPGGMVITGGLLVYYRYTSLTITSLSSLAARPTNVKGAERGKGTLARIPWHNTMQ